MAFKDSPDHVLIQECHKGNARAFDLLFDRYFNKLHFFTLKHVKDRVVTEEIVMDVMTRLWERREHFTLEVSLGPYLFRAVKNAIVDHYRKKEVETIDIAHITESHLSSHSAEDRLALEELNLVYRLQVDKLTPQQKKVFELSREEEMTYNQIASRLNLSVKTVENHITAALACLRKNINPYTNSLMVLVSWIFL